MLDGLAPDIAPRLMVAIGGVALAFLVLIAVLVFLKRRNSPLFVKGGKAREQRLLVLDAAAVDARRRLVLVRRDNTEHLIMIGGPTDVVIETGIDAQTRKSAAEIAARRAEPVVAETRREPVAEPAARQPVQARQAETPAKRVEPQAVSAAGAVLYGDEDREVPAQAHPRGEAGQAADAVEGARRRVQAETRNDDAVEAIQLELEARKAEEAARVEAERVAAARRDAERAEAIRAEAARLEAERLEAARAEAARAEAERLEAARREAARLEAERAAAARAAREKQEQERAEAARQEAERVARARAEAMARFEAARRMQAEQQRAAAAAAGAVAAEQSMDVPKGPVEVRAYTDVEKPLPAQFAATAANIPEVHAPAEQQVAESAETNGATERLASDFEKLLEAELEAGGILESKPDAEAGEPVWTADTVVPSVEPVTRHPQPITGAQPGPSAEQDMARKLSEITLNKKNDRL